MSAITRSLLSENWLETWWLVEKIFDEEGFVREPWRCGEDSDEQKTLTIFNVAISAFPSKIFFLLLLLIVKLLLLRSFFFLSFLIFPLKDSPSFFRKLLVREDQTKACYWEDRENTMIQIKHAHMKETLLFWNPRI